MIALVAIFNCSALLLFPVKLAKTAVLAMGFIIAKKPEILLWPDYLLFGQNYAATGNCTTHWSRFTLCWNRLRRFNHIW